MVIQYDSLQIQDYTQWDFFYIHTYLASCDLSIPQERAVVKFYQFCLSQELFGNPKIISFVESVGILIISFFLANKITKTSYAGILTVIIIMASRIFTDNTTTFGYSTEWAFFFILSIYLIYTKPVFFGPVFIISILAKGIVLLFIPVIIYLIYQSDLPAKTKKISYISIGCVLLLVLIYTVFIGNNFIQTNIPIGFYPEKLDGLLYNIYYNFTIEAKDSMLLYLFLPLVLVGLFRTHLPLFIFIVYLFTMQLWLPLFSDYNMGSYRLVPLILFLGIGASVAFCHYCSPDKYGKTPTHTNKEQNCI